MGDADESRPAARMSDLPPLQPHRPYRSSQLVTGECENLLSSPRREDAPPAETLEELMRRLRELCRLMAYVSALDHRCATLNPGQASSRRHADAARLLDHMFRRAGADLQHVARMQRADDDKNE